MRKINDIHFKLNPAVIFASLVCVLVASGWHSNARVTTQEKTKGKDQDRVKVLEKGNDFDPPVDVTVIKSRIGVIEPDRGLSAGEDWFKGLTVGVRNASEKPITHISLNVRFPRPKGQEKELDFVETLKYGESPIPTKDGQLPLSPAEPVLPGESVELSLPDDEYDTLRELLRDSNYPPNVKKIKVYVTLLGFSDGTIWMAGKIYGLDRSNPGRLIPLEKKKAPSGAR